MKIAVFGWYGHDNAGDERLKYCLNHYLMSLGGIDKIDFYDLHENAIKGKTSKFDSYDLVIVGGGGLILSQCNYHDFINGLQTKLAVLGVSVERPKLTGNSKKFAIALLEKSCAFYVRDEESKQKLSRYDTVNKVKVSADLTFLEPYKPVNISDNKKIGINILPKPLHFKYSTLSSPFFSFILRVLNFLGIKNCVKVIDFKNIIQHVQTIADLLPIPLYCAPQDQSLALYQKTDIEFLKTYFKDVPVNFSDKDLDKCIMFLSMRLHGAIFAVQKGIPVLSLSYLPKNRNFMERADLQELLIESLSPKNIMNKIEYISKNSESIQKKMLQYTQAESQKIRHDVKAIINLVSGS